jgi:hypothetical protein
MTLDDLDKLAAEKVMGWHAVHTSWCEKRVEKCGGKDELFPDWFLMPHDFWQPTRRIEQAWECLEKFGSQTVDRNGDEWSCWMPGIERQCAPTAPEAIVRACLRAKGVEV